MKVGITGQFERLSSEVLEDCSEIYYRVASEEVAKELNPKVANLTHQHRHAERSFPCSADDVYDRRGIEDQILPSKTET